MSERVDKAASAADASRAERTPAPGRAFRLPGGSLPAELPREAPDALDRLQDVLSRFDGAGLDIRLELQRDGDDARELRALLRTARSEILRELESSDLGGLAAGDEPFPAPAEL